MRRKGMILAALGVPALMLAPARVAYAAGPLLSGYGGPGAGAQAIVGATLLEGSGGGSGGSGTGGESGSGAPSPSSSPSSSSPPASSTSSRPASRSHGAGGSSGRRGSTGAARSARSGGSSSTATAVSAGASWFTSGDLLALGLAVGVLALIAAATVRLAGAGGRHE